MPFIAASFAFFALGLSLLVPRVVSANVVINEVLFDPVGTDTGLEKIEIYNPGDTALDIGGWELYPDGVGYFSFPNGFSLAPRSFAVVHLRVSGAGDAVNLYHASASGNMGNSSGSVALFRSGGRSAETIADFVRYHKPGSAERKTWESTAAEAGLWAAGAFVDVAALGEGSSIALAADGVRGNASAWRIAAVPSLGSVNTAVGTSAPSSLPPSASPPSGAGETPAPPAVGSPPVRSLGADAGADATVLAGTSVPFRGAAYGLDGEVLESARFLWNFGDGSTQEGRSLAHIYHFPGTYHAGLAVQSGYLAGSDWRMITVSPPLLIVSEIKPGADGFVEIFNSADQAVDLGGMALVDDRKAVFRIPPGTIAGAGTAVVFPSIISRLDPSSSLELLDARGVALDQAGFSAALPASASWERVGDSFRQQSSPTPGAFARINPAPAPARHPSPAPVLSQTPQTNVRVVADHSISSRATSGVEASSSSPPRADTSAGAGATKESFVNTASLSFASSKAFFAASVLLGVVAASAIVFLKRSAS